MTGLVPSAAITRRSLLLAGAAAAAAAAIPGAARAAKQRGRVSHLDRSAWEPHVGAVIEVRNPGFVPVPLTLLRIEDVPNVSRQTARFRQRAFVLVFRGPAGEPLGEGAHLLRLRRVGKVPVWFSHATLDADGWTYVAAFANAKLKARRRNRKPRGKGQRGGSFG